eukprot:145744_1
MDQNIKWKPALYGDPSQWSDKQKSRQNPPTYRILTNVIQKFTNKVKYGIYTGGRETCPYSSIKDLVDAINRQPIDFVTKIQSEYQTKLTISHFKTQIIYKSFTDYDDGCERMVTRQKLIFSDLSTRLELAFKHDEPDAIRKQKELNMSRKKK